MTFQPSENILNILAPSEGCLLIESFDGRDTAQRLTKWLTNKADRSSLSRFQDRSAAEGDAQKQGGDQSGRSRYKYNDCIDFRGNDH